MDQIYLNITIISSFALKDAENNIKLIIIDVFKKDKREDLINKYLNNIPIEVDGFSTSKSIN